MNELLEKISAKYKVKEEEKAANVKILNQILKDMIKHLKNDELFAALYTEADPAGSYWDGLKVEHPNEYDINFKFYFPRLCLLYVERQFNGNLTVEVDCRELEKQNLCQYKKLPTLLDENGYLSWDKVNRWFERIVQFAVLDLQYHWTSYKGLIVGDTVIIKQQKNGPAKTLRIYNENNIHVFDVDLVPCFFIDSRRNTNLWPDSFYRYGVELGYYLIPKPNEHPTHWRPSFQKQEKVIINKKDSAKQVVRLIKVIRNKHPEMHFLKSYFIKTVLLWMLLDDPATFDRKTLKYALTLVLSRLENFVSTGKIPFFWQPGCNLIEKEKNITCANISRRLRLIIKYLVADEFSKIKELFGFDIMAQLLLTNDEEHESTDSATNMLETSSNSSAGGWILGIGAALAIGGVLMGVMQSNRNN